MMGHMKMATKETLRSHYRIAILEVCLHNKRFDAAHSMAPLLLKWHTISYRMEVTRSPHHLPKPSMGHAKTVQLLCRTLYESAHLVRIDYILKFPREQSPEELHLTRL